MMRLERTFLAACTALILAAGPATAQTTPAAPTPAKAVLMIASAIPCTDFDRSIAFYTKGVGMILGGNGGNPTEKTLQFPGGGPYLMLQKARTPVTPPPARTAMSRVILEVPDLKALSDRLTAVGYPLKGRINVNAQYHVSTATMEDPDGNVFELIQHGP